MRSTIALAFLALALSAGTAQAGCAYGQKNLAGSLGPGQSDGSRSFTVNGSAGFFVRVVTGGPLTANLGCGWNTSQRHGCRRYGYGEQFVSLVNPTGRTITYRWICRH